MEIGDPEISRSELEQKLRDALEKIQSVELRANDVIAAMLAQPPIVFIGRERFCGYCGTPWTCEAWATLKAGTIHKPSCPLRLAQQFVAERDALIAATKKLP